MNADLITTLLFQSEGDTLDFKRDQYALAGADNSTKAELIKDILALANAWKTADAHILIGVDENASGGKATVVGVADHLDDADLQQLVSSKTNRPVKFHYRAVTVDGKSIGVIAISADQDRPLYLHRDFGGLKSNVVKIRRGSSTVDATPDEVAAMAVAKLKNSQSTPRIEFEFADIAKRRRLGHAIKLSPVRFVKPEPPLRRSDAFEEMKRQFSELHAKRIDLLNTLDSSSDFLRPKKPTPEELFQWRQEKAQMCAVGFWAKNAGDQPLADVRVVIKGLKMEGVIVWDDTCHPDDVQHMPLGGSYRLPTTASVTFEDHGDQWTIEILLGKIQPQSDEFVSDLLYLGSIAPLHLDWKAYVFSDHLSIPVEIDLTLNIEPFELPYDEATSKHLDEVRSVGFAEPAT